MKPIDVLQLGGIEPGYLSIYRETWNDGPQSVPRPTPMGNLKNCFSVDVVPLCPPTPGAFHHRTRVDQNTVEVK